MDWSAIRQKFPVCTRLTYLNAAGGSPMCVDAAVEARRYYDEMLQFGDTCWEDWLERAGAVRSVLAAFIGAGEDEVAFIPNTSTGMGIMALMLQGQGGVIAMEDEFPSTTLPWKNLGYQVDFAVPENGRYSDNALKASLRPEHRILLTSYVQYRTGFRQNLEAVGRFCRSEGLLFGVNATQAMGVFPVDVEKAGIDFLVFSGLKWACAGYGSSGIFISRRLLQQHVLPLAGWRSVVHPGEMNYASAVFRQDAAVLEAGAPNFPAVFALGGALQLFNSLGRETCMNRVLYLSRVLERTLLSKGLPVVPVTDESKRSGIIMVKTPDAARLTDALLKRNIVVSARGVGLRISVNIFNHEEDIDKLASGLQELMQRS